MGEIGLDYYWDKTYDRAAEDAFHQQIEWALHYDLPIVIHSSDSMEECIDIVQEHQKGSSKASFIVLPATFESARRLLISVFTWASVEYLLTKIPDWPRC